MANPQRLSELFNEAKTLPPGAERDRYLDASCKGDAQLRQRLCALLRANESAGDFLKPAELNLPGTLPGEGVGDLVDRYKLIEKIGEGGCGVVYLAEQNDPVRRRLALKVIKLGMDTKSVIARFEAERQALAMMDHPNIAKVFDGGATQTGRPYFVMELVRGVSITAFCDEARLTTKQRLQLFVQVCQAVQHAHQKGIIHRDLKPSNILVTVNDGVAVPKVIDFGIAKATGQLLTEKTLVTHFNLFIGTPAYTSPEQAEMSSVDIDTRSDIYSLGVLLYELLTGQTPFNSKELLESGLDRMRETICHAEPATPSACFKALEISHATTLSGKRQAHAGELIVALKGDLDSIVMKCLEKDRSRRYETVTGLSRDIERHLNHEPVAARSRSGLYLLRKLVRRNKGVLTAVISILAVLLGAVLLLSISNLRIRDERNQKENALTAARASEQRAREQLFDSLQNQAQARRSSRQIGQRIESLAALSEAARIRATPELRDNAIAAMAIPDIEDGPVWKLDNADLVDITYDSSYQRYARLSRDGLIKIASIPDNRELQRLGSEASTTAASRGGQLTFSPDGKYLARAAETGKLSIWDWESGVNILKSPFGQSSGPVAFTSDNRLLAVAHEDWITCFDLATGERDREWQVRDRAFRLAFDAGSSRLAVGYVASNLVSIYDANAGSHVAEFSTGDSRITSVAWHPHGRLLATGGSDPRIQIWDVERQTRIALLEGPVQQINLLMFHVGGELLASMSWDNVMRLWETSPGRMLMKFPPRWMGSNQQGRWSGAFQLDKESARLWGVVQSQEYHTFTNNFSASNNELREGSISPDGRLLALGASDGVRLWDIMRCQEIAHLPIGDTTCTHFRSDGRELLTCGVSGLQSWSTGVTAAPGTGLQLDPPRKIELPFEPLRMVEGSDHRTLAVVGERAGQGLILDLSAGEIRIPKMLHPGVSFVAISTDGMRLATSGWFSQNVKLWDAQSGKLLKELGGAVTSRVFFTPRNELVVAHDKEFTFHSLDSLEVSRRFPREIGLYAGHIAFTDNAKMMAMEMAPGLIHLKEVTSGRTIAKLEDPQGDASTWMGFTPDGTQLVVVARYAGAIHRWDLRAIRARLKAMNLDWEWPEFPPPTMVEK